MDHNMVNLDKYWTKRLKLWLHESCFSYEKKIQIIVSSTVITIFVHVFCTSLKGNAYGTKYSLSKSSGLVKLAK